MTGLCIGVAILCSSTLARAAEAPRGSITIDRIAEIKYPTDPAWSPDGRMVAFLWDAAGRQELFVATPGQPPAALTDFAVDPDLLVSDIGAFAWAAPGEILFGRDGRLWTVATASPRPRVRDGLADAGRFALSPDRGEIAFLRQGQIWLASLAGTSQRQLTFLPPPLAAAVPVFSRDGRWLAFTAAASSLEPEALRWNGDRVRSYEPSTTARRLGIVSVDGGDPAWIPTIGAVGEIQWSADAAVIYQEISPDGRTLAFVSDRTGWIQIYVIPTAATSEAQARQLTTGNALSGLGGWSPDGRRLAYHHSAPGNQFERFIDVLEVASGRSEPVVTARGVSLDPVFSPAGDRIVYQHSDVESSLDLYVAPARARAAPVRLTDSMPPGLKRSDLTPPVPATLMVSKSLDRTRRHPALVWIHGSGSDQNFLGWHPGSYRMYYSLCQYLAQQG